MTKPNPINNPVPLRKPLPPLRIVFMGTPTFACATLQRLHQEHHVVGVFTAPTKPQGRGRKLRPSPVAILAESLGLTVYSFDSLNSPEPLAVLRDLAPDLGIVVAFVKLPPTIWSFFPMGCINLHSSDLPRYRGAAPVAWAIMNGEENTGLTTFFINESIDTGDLLLQKKVAIKSEDTQDSLLTRLQPLAADLISQTIQGLIHHTLHAHPQPSDPQAPKAPKLSVAQAQIDWNKSAKDIRNQVRGLCSKPGAWTLLEDKRCKIFSVQLHANNFLAPGTFAIRNKQLLVGTSTQTLSIEDLQLEGRKRMITADFLRGNPLQDL